MKNDWLKWNEYKGKRILYVNWEGATIEELPPMSEKLLNTVFSEEKKSVMYLMDINGFKFSVKALGIFNSNAEKTGPYEKGIAILGVTGLLKVMYDGFAKVNKNPMKTFSNREEALEWLVNLP